jgi:hypothetical protein
MPQLKYKISDHLINVLKFKLENKVSYQIITTSDCKKVSQLIQKEINKTISESTIYRLFLWQKNINIPYTHTLDILAEFLDLKDWTELEKELIDLVNFQFLYGVDPKSENYKSLLKITIHNNQLRSLYDFLEQFPGNVSSEKHYFIGHELFQSLKFNPNKNLTFFKNFNKLPIVREAFFEHFADPYFSIPQYEIGLKYYLNNIKPQESVKSLQDFIFGNTMLLRFYFLSNDKSKVLEYGKILYVDLAFKENELKDLYIFPKIRYFSYRLFYQFVQTGFDKIYFEWLYDFCIRELKDSTLTEKRIILHTLLDTLQIFPEFQEEMYTHFESLFPEVFTRFPAYVKKLPIMDRLCFLEPNAVRFHDRKIRWNDFE